MNFDDIKNKVEEAADKLVDSKLDGEKAEQVKNAVHGGVEKGAEALKNRLGGAK